MNLDDPLTEKRVAKHLLRDRWVKHVCLPNYTPAGWWECDLMMITESGYWWEFEVKLTLADFRRDGEKKKEVGPWTSWGKDRVFESKHDLLANSSRGPACFYYVAPVGVIPVVALPAWAGLIEIEQRDKYLLDRTVVKAPRRHGEKADPAIRAHIYETCYWRFHRGSS